MGDNEMPFTNPGEKAVSEEFQHSTKLEQELWAAKAKYKTLVEQIPAVTFIGGLDGETVFVSPQLESMLGYTPDEWLALGSDWVRHIHPEDRPRVTLMLEQSMGTGRSFDSEFRLIARDGRALWFHTSTTIVLDESGKPLFLHGVAMDVTGKREAQNLLKRQVAAMRASSDGLMISDESERFIFVNDALLAMHGYDHPEEVLGQSWRILYDPHELSRWEAVAYGSISASGTWRGEAEGKRRDGSRFPQEVSVTRLAEGGFVCMIRDITERKRAEADAVRRTQAIEEANLRLLELDRLKNNFLSNVSHELRTPLTLIIGYAQLLGDTTSPALTLEQQEHLANLLTGAERLSHIVEALLTYTMLETQLCRLELVKVDLRQLVQTKLAHLQPMFQNAGYAVELSMPEQPIVVKVDPQRIEQVMLNLMENVLKFTQPAGPVSVTVNALDREARVEVTDSGTGIPEEYQPCLFEKFFQVDSSMTRKQGGLGLGLALSKALIEAHGGTIGVHSAPERGATFWFSLPIAP